MLWNLTPWIHLKLTVQMQAVPHPCRSFFIDTRNMNANIVEKDSVVMLNVKLQVKVRFKTFYWLLELLYTAFALNANSETACFARNYYIS